MSEPTIEQDYADAVREIRGLEERVREWRTEARRLGSEYARVRAALIPFAAIQFDGSSPIGYRASFTREDVERALAALRAYDRVGDDTEPPKP